MQGGFNDLSHAKQPALCVAHKCRINAHAHWNILRFEFSLSVWKPIKSLAQTCFFPSLLLKASTSMSRICLKSLFHCLKKISFHFHWSSASADGGMALSSPLDSQPSPRNSHPLPISSGRWPVVHKELSSFEDTKTGNYAPVLTKAKNSYANLSSYRFLQLPKTRALKNQVPGQEHWICLIISFANL